MMEYLLPKETIIAKLRLFLWMLIAANTSAFAIYFLCVLANTNINYLESMALFLGYRVLAFMANKQMPLTDENVAFMSSERMLWNSMTILVAVFTMGVLYVLNRLI